MPPLYESDRKAAEESDETLRSHNGFAILGVLWLAGVYVGWRTLSSGEGSPLALGLACAGACLPLLVLRIRGSRDALGLATWIASGVPFLAGLVLAALRRHPEVGSMGVLLPVVFAAEVAASALVCACGGYAVSRVVGSLAAERRVFYVASALMFGLNLILRASVLGGFGLGRIASLGIWLAQASVVTWTYFRFLALRPHLRRVEGVFE